MRAVLFLAVPAPSLAASALAQLPACSASGRFLPTVIGEAVPRRCTAASAAVPCSYRRVLPPVGVLVGIYLIWAGADQRGGAFQGGAVIAAMWAGLVHPPRLDATWLGLVLFIGPAAFITAGFAGFAVAEGFLSYPVAFAKPIIIGVEVALTASIAAIAALMIVGPATGHAR